MQLKTNYTTRWFRLVSVSDKKAAVPVRVVYTGQGKRGIARFWPTPHAGASIGFALPSRRARLLHCNPGHASGIAAGQCGLVGAISLCILASISVAHWDRHDAPEQQGEQGYEPDPSPERAGVGTSSKGKPNQHGPRQGRIRGPVSFLLIT